jgi:hypothetical protein
MTNEQIWHSVSIISLIVIFVLKLKYEDTF